MKNLLFAMMFASFAGQANAFVVDGNIDEWLSSKATWAPVNGAIHSTIEDQTGKGYLNPGYGGQAYDAEALYATIFGNKLFIALATGHNPLTPTSGKDYGAGDFAIDFGKDGSYELGINYKNPNGVSVSDNFGDHAGLYAVSEWYYGLWQAPGSHNPANAMRSDPTSIKSGTKLGVTEFAYNTVAKKGYGAHAKDGHYFYEMSVDLDLLRNNGWDGSAFNIHWTENCANDTIVVDPDQPLPEPASMALFGVAMFSLLAMRRRVKAG